jgi:peptidoglycan/LPS O-acetylase OafA/YrhL
MVMLLHFTLTYRLGDSPLTWLIPKPWLRAALINGNYGVTMFFVISGFLITSISMNRYGGLERMSVKGFYAFRFARITPPLLLALAIIVPLGLLGLPSFRNAAQGVVLSRGFFFTVVLSILTFWHNVLMALRGYFNYSLNIYWSLSVEEAFYLAFPLLCVGWKRQRLLIAGCVLALVAGPIYRQAHRADEIRFMYGYLACFDAIALGCLTALLTRRFDLKALRQPWVQAAAALTLALIWLWGIDGHEALGFSLMALGTALLLVGARSQGEAPEPVRRFPVRLMRWFGGHSYELYLFHIIVLGLMRDFVPREALSYGLKLPWLLLYLALSTGVAALVAARFSEPMNAVLRRRLSPPAI